MFQFIVIRSEQGREETSQTGAEEEREITTYDDLADVFAVAVLLCESDSHHMTCRNN